jgi:hypothetical protein
VLFARSGSAPPSSSSRAASSWPRSAAASSAVLRGSPDDLAQWRHCHSTLSLTVIGFHPLGIYIVILLSLLSFSVKMIASPRASATLQPDGVLRFLPCTHSHEQERSLENRALEIL